MKLYKFEEEAPVPEKKDDEKEEKEKEKEKKEEKKKEAAAAAPVKRWVERCLGSFKVNVDKKTEKARVIMRTECTFNTRLNALILSSSKCTMDSNGRAFIFSTFETDAESGKAVFNIYMIRFNSKEKATAAFDAVTKEIEKAKQKDEDKKKEEEEEGK